MQVQKQKLKDLEEECETELEKRIKISESSIFEDTLKFLILIIWKSMK